MASTTSRAAARVTAGAGLVLALLLAAGTAAAGGAPGVTDLSTANAAAIQSGDIVEALAVPRGTHILPGARPTVRLPIYFEFNSAKLRPEAVELLGKVGDALVSDDLETFRFSVEGHTDAVGTEGYNQSLSAQRAAAVKTFLAERGVAPDRLQTVGRGESDPVASNDSEEGRQRNRRVEIINLGSEP